MPQRGLIFRALVASPSDCADERKIVPQIIAEWNAINSKSTAAVIEPVLWESHSRPQTGDRPQALLNEQIVSDCDLVIGTFWTRLGTPTGIASSGTAEEIDHFIAAGKPTLVYFSAAPVHPDSLDPSQYSALTSYKRQLQGKGLSGQYESLSDLRNQLQRHLASEMISLLKAEGKSTSTSLDDSSNTDIQASALRQFLSNYEAFVRRFATEWIAERDSEPHSTEEAKYLLGRAADEVVSYQSAITNDSLGIADGLADCLKRLKANQRKQMYMDGGVTWTEFWSEGDLILQRLRDIGKLISEAAKRKAG